MKVIRKQGVNLNVILANLSKKSVKVGWFDSSKYQDGTPTAYVAAIQEFGVPEKNIPARPFMRPTIKAQKENWGNLAQSGARSVLKGNSDITDVMTKLGGKVSADIQETITTITSPALAPKTIAARLRKRADSKTVGNLTKPLVDSGYMLDQVKFLVE